MFTFIPNVLGGTTACSGSPVAAMASVAGPPDRMGPGDRHRFAFAEMRCWGGSHPCYPRSLALTPELDDHGGTQRVRGLAGGGGGPARCERQARCEPKGLRWPQWRRALESAALSESG
jgi:hypothetical protein